MLKFSSGALGVIEATTATRPSDLEGSIWIVGENGAVEIAPSPAEEDFDSGLNSGSAQQIAARLGVVNAAGGGSGRPPLNRARVPRP